MVVVAVLSEVVAVADEVALSEAVLVVVAEVEAEVHRSFQMHTWLECSSTMT